MQNGPNGTGNPNNLPVHNQAAKKTNDFIQNDPDLDEESKSEEEKERESSPEDFKPFNVDAVDKLNKSKKETKKDNDDE